MKNWQWNFKKTNNVLPLVANKLLQPKLLLFSLLILPFNQCQTPGSWVGCRKTTIFDHAHSERTTKINNICSQSVEDLEVLTKTLGCMLLDFEMAAGEAVST